jgi:hypothetical protein
MNLWTLPVDDKNYKKVCKNIECILTENLANVELSLQIYEEYAYLLKEMDKAVAWAN